MSRSATSGLNAAGFLRRYWQKQPVLLKGLFSGDPDALSPEELAGLAMEEDVDARLVFHEPKKDRWSIEYGPFPEQRFLDLPASHYTLLVQNVDHYVPAVAALRQRFAFLPRWRFDDVMISYATEGGGVGPHIDQYDVFLIQGRGTRRWQVGDKDQTVTANDSVRALRQVLPFKASMDVLVEPGDVLYIPPNTPHWGTALEPCMTYSVGFRAPAQTDILARLAALRTEHCLDGRRYADPDLKPAQDDGEIPAAAFKQVQDLLRTAAEDPRLLAQAFASLLTQTRHDLARPKELRETTVRKWWDQGRAFHRVDDARLVWFRDGRKICLMGNGHLLAQQDLSADLARLLCNSDVLEPGFHADLAKDVAFFPLLTTLLNSGVFYET